MNGQEIPLNQLSILENMSKEQEQMFALGVELTLTPKENKRAQEIAQHLQRQLHGFDEEAATMAAALGLLAGSIQGHYQRDLAEVSEIQNPAFGAFFSSTVLRYCIMRADDIYYSRDKESRKTF